MKKMGSKAEPAKRSVSVYIDKEILEVIKEEAEKEDRSISGYINWVMWQHIRKKEAVKE